MSSPYNRQPVETRSEYDTAPINARTTINFTLTFHLDDGTTKDVPCVGTFVKEQEDDNRS